MLAVDTNIVVRYLAGDNPKQTPKARALLKTVTHSFPIPSC